MTTAVPQGSGKVYPKAVSGAFRRVKDALSVGLLAVFFVTPWLRWDRGAGVADQAILLDMEARRGFLFDLEIWPQDIYWLTGVVILGVLGLFMTSAVAGRVWCGFACPQTVFTDLFVRIEQFLEGGRAARMALDRAPWTVGKLWRKAVKHGLWLMLSLAVGVTFTLWFVDAPTAVGAYLTLSAGPWMWTFVLTLTATSYILAGFARQQMCNAMCPWPRIQSAMLDDHSLVVTYRADRGDRRGPKRKSQTWAERTAEGFGDCINCVQCVQVCPMGIDIRQGVNADCINCGLCIDACDSIMDGIGRPRKLIAFDSFANAEGRRQGRSQPATRLLRPRNLGFAAVLLVGTVGLGAGVLGRADLGLTALKERAPLFVTLSDGRIRNDYTLKIVNKERQPRALSVHVEGLPGARIRLLTGEDGRGDGALLRVDGDAVGAFKAFVSAPVGGVRPDDVTIVLRDPVTGTEVREPLAFSWPRG